MPIPLWLSLLACLLAVPARAEVPVWHEPLWLQPPGADAPFPVLLALPLGWQPGDAAVVLLPDPDGPAAPRHRLASALLAAEAVVVELDPVAAWAAVPTLRPQPALALPGCPAALRAALDRLRVETGAGLLVVLGLGPAGAVALAAVAWPGVAAAAALDGAPRFLAGARPAAAEQWPLRAGLLCALLAGAEGGAAAQRDCRAALLP